MAKRDLIVEASADIDVGGLPLTVALSRRPDPDTKLLDLLLEARLNLTDHPQSISLKKILSALFGSSVGDELEKLGLNIELQLDKVALDLYFKQKKIVFVVAIKGETNFKKLGVKEKKVKDGEQSSTEQEAKAKFGVLIIKQKGQKAKICFFVQVDDFLEPKSTSLEEAASKWTKICYVKLQKWKEEEEEEEEKKEEEGEEKEEDSTSEQDPPSETSSSGGASSSSSGGGITELTSALSSLGSGVGSLIGVFGQFAGLGAGLLTIAGLIARRSCSEITAALQQTHDSTHKANEPQPLVLPRPDKQMLLGLVQQSSNNEPLAYKQFINYYQYYYYKSETQSLSRSDVHNLSTIFIEAYPKINFKTKLATQALIDRSVQPDWIIAELGLSAQELDAVLDVLLNKNDLNQLAVYIKQANQVLQERRIPPFIVAHALKAISERMSAEN